MPDPQILSIATMIPEHEVLLEEVVQQAQLWVAEQKTEFQTKVSRIFKRAGVLKRYTTLPLRQLFQPMTLAEKNDIYRAHIVDYAEKALTEALNKLNLKPSDLDCLIVTSCTGHMSPSLETFLINRLDLKPSIQRLPVMEMGCLGGVAGLIYAENYCRAYPGKYAAIIAAELTSITFQREDFSWANIVSTAIFGDGIACAIMGNLPSSSLPRLRFSNMHHFPHTTHLLGYNLGNNGFQMVLDPELPLVIRTQFLAIISSALQAINWQLEDLDEFLIHPGGLKILSEIESLIGPLYRHNNLEQIEQKFQLGLSRQILETHGNMSSATVLFLLKQWLEAENFPEKALIAAFGPGLTAGLLLLEADTDRPSVSLQPIE